MESQTPVERSYVVGGATPREVYDVVVDFESYPRLFRELKAVRVLERQPPRVRVEFRADIVLPVRYVLDVVCDAAALAVDWTFVEGQVVAGSTGSWRFVVEPAGVKVVYRVAMTIKAPLPAFVVRKASDALVAASIPGMFAAIDREVRSRREAREP